MESVPATDPLSVDSQAILPDSVSATDKPKLSPLYLSLLPLSGVRVALSLDQDYITKHGIRAPGPDAMTVLDLKECLLADWSLDWGDFPGDTDHIRLIYLGRLLDDKDSLLDSRLSRSGHNVIHLSTRPSSFGVLPLPKSPKSGHARHTSTNEVENSSSLFSRSRPDNHPAPISASENGRQVQSESSGCGCIIS
ncbi:uncharacterized protein V1516DRAFT_674749 [Lipomyces oligophaga]|uniref:uncharacterized protein n=1 Tax=Lipomyces oligophaga TaxID=45792 RepID=UPI0034D01C29